MLVFIDEAGCPGFSSGSSDYFVIALVIFEDNKIAEDVDKRIELLKQKSGVKPEYKFSKTKDCYKEDFFKSLKDFDFKCSAIIVHKEKIYSSDLKTKPKAFYNYFLKQILTNSRLHVPLHVKIDKSSSKVFQQEAKLYLQRQTQALHPKIKFQDSKSNNLIQLADMVAGAVLRSCGTKHDKDKWISFLAGKWINFWFFE